MTGETPHPGQNRRSVFGIFILFLIVAAGGAAYLYYHSDWRVPEQMKKMQNPYAANSEAVDAGMMVYMERCKSCHGEDGDGKGEKAKDLSVTPANFTDAHAMSTVTDGELFWKITSGRRPMPSFKDKLTDEERWQVVTYIRTLAPKPNSGAPAQP